MGQVKKMAEDISWALGYEGDLDAPVVRYALEHFDCYMHSKPLEAKDMAIQAGRNAQKYVEGI
jgi:hypothetical protein